MPPGMFWRDGFYYVRATVAGKRLKKSTGKADFKSAMRRYHEIMLAWNNQESGWDSGPSNVPTLKDYWTNHYRPSWVVGRKTPNRGTKDDYRDDSLIATALVDLGHRKLSDITPTMAQKWAQKRRGMTFQRRKGGTQYPISEGTVTREVALLHTMFTHAVDDEFIEKNPWTKASQECGPYTVRDRVLSLADQDKLQETLPPWLYRFVLFLLGTGLRLEEALGIDETSDLDLDQKQLMVTRKTRGLKKKRQVIPLFDENVVDVLRTQLKEENTLWHQPRTTLQKALEFSCKKAGIEHISPHTLRHTFATRYLKSGGDIYILSKLLGHSSVAITERVYAHLVSADLGARSAHVNLGLGVEGKVVPFKKRLTP